MLMAALLKRIASLTSKTAIRQVGAVAKYELNHLGGLSLLGFILIPGLLRERGDKALSVCEPGEPKAAYIVDMN